jgi:serine/threonine kinase PknH
VIARGMAKDPADRYPTAGDLALDAHHALSAPDQQQAISILQHSQRSAPAPSPPPTWPPFTLASAPTAPAPPRAGRNPWLVLATAALVVIATLGGLGIWLATRTTGGGAQPGRQAPTTPASTTTAATASPARLDSILLSAAQINTIMGASNIQPIDTVKTDKENPSPTLSVLDCLGAALTAQRQVYAPSGYIAVRRQGLKEPGDTWEHIVIEAAVGFPTADKAGVFVTASAAKWKACAGQTVTETDINGRTGDWTFGSLAGDPPKITLLHTPEGGGGWACQHVLSAASTEVIDVSACGYHISDEGGRIADAMAANATR